MRCRLGAFIAMLLLLIGCAAAALSADEKNEPRRFVLEVKSQVTGAELRLRGAVGYDGQLELIETTTPFRKEIEAVGVTALFAVVDSDGSVIAVLYEMKDDELKKYGDVRGRAVKIIQEPRDPLVPLTFTNF